MLLNDVGVVTHWESRRRAGAGPAMAWWLYDGKINLSNWLINCCIRTHIYKHDNMLLIFMTKLKYLCLRYCYGYDPASRYAGMISACRNHTGKPHIKTKIVNKLLMPIYRCIVININIIRIYINIKKYCSTDGQIPLEVRLFKFLQCALAILKLSSISQVNIVLY